MRARSDGSDPRGPHDAAPLRAGSGEPLPSLQPLQEVRGVLHDVANALTVVLGWVEQAADERASEAERAYALGVVRERARLAQDLARQVLVRGAAEDETARLEAVVDEVLRTLGPEAAAKRVVLGREGDALGAIVRDARALSRVVTNLVLNALAHAPPGGHVTVRIDGGEDEAQVAVVDDGPGVPAGLEASIFEGTSRRAGGAGVGLAHSRAVARRLGGDVALARRAPDASLGASFVVSWPRADAVPRAPSSRMQLDELAGVDLAVVEDDAAVVQLLVLALETRGARVRTARSRAELDELVAAHGAELDALLVDLSPLGPDAEAALVTLQARLPVARIVVVTGSADSLPSALDPRRVRVVKKPFEAREVVTALFELGVGHATKR